MSQIHFYQKEEDIRSELLQILQKVDSDFYPPLSARRSFDFWLNLFDNGSILYATDGSSGAVVGFLAYYPSLSGEIYDKLMACVNIEPVTSVKTNVFYSGAYIHFIAVLPEYRGRGISSLLMDNLLSETKQKQIDSIRVITWSTNHQSIRLYKKHGFKEIHRIPNERGKGIDSIYFEVTKPLLESIMMVRSI